MSRDNTIRLSDAEKDALDESRSTMFGTDDVPYGHVVKVLCETDADRKSADDTPTGDSEFLDDFKDSSISGKHVVMGGRQIGKTTALAYKAVQGILSDSTIVYVSPNQRNVRNMIDTIRDIADGGFEDIFSIGGTDIKPKRSVASGRMRSLSVSACNDISNELRGLSIDAIHVDNACFIDSATLSTIDNWEFCDTKLYASTPRRSVVEYWAEFSDEHTTWHVPSSAVDHISNSKHNSMRSCMSDPERELDAEYWVDDEPVNNPDFAYHP